MPIARPNQGGEEFARVLDEVEAEVTGVEPIIAELRRGFFGLLM